MKLTTLPEVFGALQNGEVAREFMEALRALLVELDAQGEGEGEVGVRLKVKMTSESSVAVTSTVTSKLPKRKKRAAGFFFSDGELQLDHPRQIAMFREPTRRAETIDHE